MEAYTQTVSNITLNNIPKYAMCYKFGKGKVIQIIEINDDKIRYRTFDSFCGGFSEQVFLTMPMPGIQELDIKDLDTIYYIPECDQVFAKSEFWRKHPIYNATKHKFFFPRAWCWGVKFLGFDAMSYLDERNLDEETITQHMAEYEKNKPHDELY
jgi:hypothetical protein